MRKLRTNIRRFFPMLCIGLILGGPVSVTLTACQPKVCPANNRPTFNRKRQRFAMMNHMKRRGGKGHRHKASKHRKPKFKFFQTRFKRKQFKHQTK